MGQFSGISLTILPATLWTATQDSNIHSRWIGPNSFRQSHFISYTPHQSTNNTLYPHNCQTWRPNHKSTLPLFDSLHIVATQSTSLTTQQFPQHKMENDPMCTHSSTQDDPHFHRICLPTVIPLEGNVRKPVRVGNSRSLHSPDLVAVLNPVGLEEYGFYSEKPSKL